jgi:addiction module RelE/StbE family toxin
MTFRISETAERHLDEIYEYIRKDKPEAALAVIERILDGIEQLTTFPKSGRSGRSGTRELVIPPFVVIYSIVDSVIDVQSVFHSSRNR